MFPSAFTQHTAKQKSHRKRSAKSLNVEHLEERSLPSTFTVLNLNDSGPGSLRQAIQSSNTNAGSDVIDFNVAGIIRLTSGALPAITADVHIDGTSAPGFVEAPRVEINFNPFGGLQFNAGSIGSTLDSLSLVSASGAGV